MNKYTRFNPKQTIYPKQIYACLVLIWLGVALNGTIPESSGGWVVANEGQSVLMRGGYIYKKRKVRRRKRGRCRRQKRRGLQEVQKMYPRRRWWATVCRSSLLGLCGGYGGAGSGYVWALIPWLVWGYQQRLLRRGQVDKAMRWRRWEQWVMIGAVLYITQEIGAQIWVWWQVYRPVGIKSLSLISGFSLATVASQPPVRLSQRFNDAGEVIGYGARLEGTFELEVAADDPFRRRCLIIFLRLLQIPDYQRGSRRTREGKTPAVPQQMIAAAYGVTQPEISRWLKYWQTRDWRRLLSQWSKEVLTLERQAQVVAIFAQFPWWGVEKVYQYCQAQKIPINRRQVAQAATESGWSQLRQALVKHYHIRPEAIVPRDNGVITDLLRLNQSLVEKLAQKQLLTPHEQRTHAQLTTLTAAVGYAAPPIKALPWACRLEQLLFGTWDMVTDASIRCLYCTSTQVSRKSRQPRLKKFYDPQGDIQSVPVYRYYCHNPACDKGSFTNLPPGLLPYTKHRLQTHLMALQLVAWARVNYRRTAQALGISSATAYRWLAACGQSLLPVASLFGLVRSSGVVCIDEKYVRVPKNNKPHTKMKHWMYLYVAVDAHTYDLLHIALYPHRDDLTTRTFLLALKHKGYRPHAIITDLWHGYANAIASVFPQARHHECIFHALQSIQRDLKSLFGSDFAHLHPHLLTLKHDIYAIFQPRTRRTARKRFRALMAKEAFYLALQPELKPIFTFLDRHELALLAGYASKTIPKTNNAAELFIRRFDQHYQNFGGFDSLDSARTFIAVFEKVYRFTPFSQDAAPHLRGKCPLELAGYDIADMPMTALCAGLSPDWPISPEAPLVPNL